MSETALALLSSLITGLLSFLGVVYTTRKQHDFTISEIKTEVQMIKKDINSLEEKQDRHNKVIDRVYSLETASQVLEVRQKAHDEQIKELEERMSLK